MAKRNKQEGPRVERNTFKIQDPNSDKPKMIEVVFASFAACIEREANDLRDKLEKLDDKD